MRWQHCGPTAMASEDGRYMINRSPADGGPATFMLVALGKPWPARRDEAPSAAPRGWDGSRIVALERDVPDTREDRAAAIRRLRNLIEVVE